MSIVKDMALAESGRRKIQWVRDFMPALAQIEARFEKEQPFRGLRVAVSVHLEAKTANLGYVLSKGGAQVSLTGSNPPSTQDDVAAGLASLGVETFGIHGASAEEYEAHLIETLKCRPHIVIDDGGDLIDLLGGVDIDVTEAERKALNKGLFDLSSLSGMEKLQESGENVHLNGNQATAFARIRKIDSDYVRTNRQRTVLMAMARKLKDGASAGTLLTIVNVLLNYVETDLSISDILEIGTVGLDMDLSTVEELRLPADGTFESGMYGNVWCIKPNFEKNAALLQEFIYGEAE